MDVIVATLTSVQWTTEDNYLVKEVSSSCGFCGGCFPLKPKKKSKGRQGTKPLNPAYRKEALKKEIFCHLLHGDILAKVVRNINRSIRRSLKAANAPWSSRKVEEAEIMHWIGNLLWSGLLGFDTRPTKETISLSMKRYHKLFANVQFRDIFTAFSSAAKGSSAFLHEMNELQDKLALICKHIFSVKFNAHTLCVEKYKVDLNKEQPHIDLRVVLLVDTDTGFICNFLIYSISQIFNESAYIPFLYIIRKLLKPFCHMDYTVQIDNSAPVNEAIIEEFLNHGIKLVSVPWFGDNYRLPNRDYAETKTLSSDSIIYFSDWEGYAIFPLNGKEKDYPSLLFFFHFWLLVHISCINAFILHSRENKDPEVDLSFEEFVELLSKEITEIGAYSGSAWHDYLSNSHKEEQKSDYGRQKEPDRMASSRIAEQGKEKGVTGLKNLGNTCYMNAVIQCLCSTVPLVEYFFSWQFENLIARDRKDFANAFAKLLAELWFGEAQSVVEPKEFWLAVCQIHPPFSRKNQHDAQELLIYVLDELHHNLTSTASRRASDAVGGSSNHTGRKVSDSPISNLLQGVLRQRKICLECGKTSQKDDIFTVLSLPIPLGKEASLYDCLQCFFQQVMLTWRDKIFCSYCKAKHDATIEVQIRKPPKILMLHLKRFEFRGGVKKKLKTNVTFPLENLDMSPFLSTYYVQYPKYNLYSVVNHSGELEFGHYTAYCKNPRTKAWNAFDDMKHFRIAEDTVQSPLAYILFYTSQEFSLPNETSSSI